MLYKHSLTYSALQMLSVQTMSLWTSSTISSIHVLNNQISVDVAERLMDELRSCFEKTDEVNDILNEDDGGSNMSDAELEAALAELEPTSEYLGIEIPSASTKAPVSMHGRADGTIHIADRVGDNSVRRRRRQVVQA